MTYPFVGGFHNLASYAPGIPWMTSTSITNGVSTPYFQYSFDGVTSYVAIRNDGPAVMRISVRSDSVTGTNGKYITIASGGSFEAPVRTTDLYLTPDTFGGTCAFSMFVGLSTVPTAQSPAYTLDWL